MRKRAEEWMEFAKVDLRSAEKLAEDELLTRAAAFHVHQSVEKSFKAILECRQQRIPKVHNLVLLLESIRQLGEEPHIDEDVLDEINQLYIESRYPADFGLLPGGAPTVEIVRKFSKFAAEFYEFAEKLIQASSD